MYKTSWLESKNLANRILRFSLIYGIWFLGKERSNFLQTYKTFSSLLIDLSVWNGQWEMTLLCSHVASNTPTCRIIRGWVIPLRYFHNVTLTAWLGTQGFGSQKWKCARIQIRTFSWYLAWTTPGDSRFYSGWKNIQHLLSIHAFICFLLIHSTHMCLNIYSF